MSVQVEAMPYRPVLDVPAMGSAVRIARETTELVLVESGWAFAIRTGYLGADATDRFTGAVGWALARGTGPVILDLTGLLGWSAGGQIAVAQAARRLGESGHRIELAAIPADGSLVPDAACPPVPVHCDLAAALAAHGARGTVKQWTTGD